MPVSVSPDIVAVCMREAQKLVRASSCHGLMSCVLRAVSGQHTLSCQQGSIYF